MEEEQQQEQQQEQEIRMEKIKEVKDSFRGCGVEDLEKDYPRLYERILVMHENGDHFKDAIEIKDIIKNLYDRLDDLEDFPLLKEALNGKIDKEQLLFASLAHDVGKVGPYRIKYRDKEERKILPGEQAFIHSNLWRHKIKYSSEFLEKNPDFRDKTFNPTKFKISEFIDVVEVDDKDKVKRILFGSDILERMGVGENEPIINMFRTHVGNSVLILNGIRSEREKGDELLNKDTVMIAGMHHTFDGQNPTGEIDEDFPKDEHQEEIFKASLVLEFVDKYQAAKKRGGVSHQKAIDFIRTKIEGSSEFNTSNLRLSQKAKDLANKMLSEFEKMEDLV